MRKTTMLLALGMALALGSAAAPRANAGVVVGVSVGTPVYVPPAYVRPVYVRPIRAYPYFVPRPYVAVAPAPIYPRVYVVPAPDRRWYPRRYVVYRGFYRHWR